MAFKFYDRVRMTVSGTPGTGNVTLGSATTAFQSFAAAGASNGDTFPYLILDGANWEFGVGTYASSGSPMVSRTTINQSSNSGAAVSFTSSAIVMCTIRAEDMVSGAGLYGGNMSVPTQAGIGLTNWLNQGSSTVADTAAGIALSSVHSGSGDQFRSLYTAAPTAPYTITALIGNINASLSGASDAWGLGWYDGTNKISAILLYSISGQSDGLTCNNYSSPTAFASNNAAPVTQNFQKPTWFQIADDGTNAHFRIGSDGVNFLEVYSVAKSSGYLGSSGYANILLACDVKSSNNITTLMSWKQS